MTLKGRYLLEMQETESASGAAQVLARRLAGDLGVLTGREVPVLPGRDFLFHPGASSRQWEHQRLELLAQYGYEISDYGDGVLAIRQIPTEIAPDDAAQSLTALAAELLTGRHADPTELRDRLLHTIACKAAIKGGWHTDPKEWEAVVHEVLTRNDLKYCPHGRPICLELTASQLERQFKRA